MEQVITRAIVEGGYGPHQWREWFIQDPHTQWTGHQWETIFSPDAQRKHVLKPEFWQALGKALGWEERINLQWSNKNLPIGMDTHWLYQWHRFIDHLAEGKSADIFFNELLK